MQLTSSVDPLTPSFANNNSSKRASLYHTCRAVLNGLAAVPGFDEYLSMEPTMPAMTAVKEDVATTTTAGGNPLSPSNTPASNDPLSKLWFICREGSSLCLLYNTLNHTTPISIYQSRGTVKMKPKACVYHFIIACRDHLGLPEERLFTVSDLYQDNTNGFVKVVNTVSHILDLLEASGMISIQWNLHYYSDQPKSTRDKVVSELLETERRYVHDLETLQNYMREAQTQQVLSPDTLHQLFGNLNALVDFQRRFLIYAEDNADRPPEEQRFGNLFVKLEDAFSVYEPFCANFKTAQDLVFQEAHKLQRLGELMNPTYELPSMLIKPVQRVCKYPLLLLEMIKVTPDTWIYYDEMKHGLAAIQRVATKINETKRRQENQLLVEDLRRRLNDHRGCDIPTFGLLLLQERFMLNRNDIDYDVQLYLFEKTLLICTDIKDSSSNTASKKAGMKASKKKKAKETDGLFMRGKISISQISQIADISQQGTYALKISWSEGDIRSNSFIYTSCTVKFRNDEQLKQWEAALNRLIKIEKRLSCESRVAAEALVQKHQPELSSSASSYTLDSFAAAVSSSFNYEEQVENRHADHSSDDEEDFGFFRRGRSHSQNAQLYHQKLQLQPEYGSKSEVSLPLPRGHNEKRCNAGIALPPPPRDMSCAAGDVPPFSYPSSPLTNSYPSTPSASNRASTCSAGSIQFWWQRKGLTLSTDEDEDDFCSAVTAPMMQPYHSNSDEEYINARTLFSVEHKSMNTRYGYSTNMSMTPPQGLNDESVNHDADDNEGQSLGIKMKLNFHNELYETVVPFDIRYKDLVSRIECKIKPSGQPLSTGALGLRYLDEEGDLITISSDDDIEMAFECCRASNTINVFVTESPSII